MAGEHVAYIGAFTAGILTFLSPCILPLIPSFIAYIAGVSYGDMKDGRTDIRKKTISHTVFFIIGFSIVFILMGLTATVLGKALFAYQKYIRIGGGALIILFGFTLTGILKIGFLEKGFHVRVREGKASYLGSLLVGVTFAAAWTPCAGPLLGSILVIAGTEGSAAEGTKLLALYSAGLGLPFLITAVAMQMFLVLFNRFKKAMAYINKAAGAILILVGALIITDSLNIISQKVTEIFIK
ncbi:MAG: cytochrome c biogenesis protein CcdA [Candidatus Omnitrophica bacterium]|nr:cytochrome c biogenesis protein CcdA [Candidatus Omnitrophota bacterium]MBU0895133.1 cytochrome c biogenesis protein CcdA [Candidatus Omnitrophota bacterium]MBU1808208.1 cytochrome c biogenesis protein CcdA [Candidatus Omnitrophota bacterium]